MEICLYSHLTHFSNRLFVNTFTIRLTEKYCYSIDIVRNYLVT